MSDDMNTGSGSGVGALAIADFERRARAAGFDEVLERRWPADAIVTLHAHPFAVDALVTEGEMWLTCGDETQHLRPGDRFRLQADEPHSERYGQAGATYWAARKNPPVR